MSSDKVKGKRKIRRTIVDKATGTPTTIEDTVDIHEGEEDMLPGAPGADELDYTGPVESLADRLRATFGDSEEGTRIELSKRDPASGAWCFLQRISIQEVSDFEAIRAIGKGDGQYKVEAFENGEKVYVKTIPIGVPATPADNPFAAIINTAGGAKSDMGTVALIMGQMMQASQEQNRLSLESTKSDMQWKMKQLEEETKIKLEQMKQDREERRAEQERMDKAQERQFNLMLQMFKKDDPSTLLAPVLTFMGSTIETLGTAITKAGKPEPEGLLGTAVGALKEFGPQLAEFLRSKTPAQANPAQPAGLPSPAGAASFSSGPGNPAGTGFVTAGGPSGNGGASAPAPPGIPDLNVIKQQMESNALPMLFTLAEKAVLQEGPEGPEWGPEEEHDPGTVAGSLYMVYKQNYPGISREQFGSLVRAVIGTEQQFLTTYPKTLEHEQWFREFYREITLIVDNPEPAHVEVMQ